MCQVMGEFFLDYLDGGEILEKRVENMLVCVCPAAQFIMIADSEFSILSFIQNEIHTLADFFWPQSPLFKQTQKKRNVECLYWYSIHRPNALLMNWFVWNELFPCYLFNRQYSFQCTCKYTSIFRVSPLHKLMVLMLLN